MKYGLNDSEIDYLLNNVVNPEYSPTISEALTSNNLEEFQTNICLYLVEPDCMYYDEDGQNWYTKKGHYVQSLYDKILDWKYGDK